MIKYQKAEAATVENLEIEEEAQRMQQWAALPQIWCQEVNIKWWLINKKKVNNIHASDHHQFKVWCQDIDIGTPRASNRIWARGKIAEMRGAITASYYMNEECEEKRREEITFKEHDQNKINEN